MYQYLMLQFLIATMSIQQSLSLKASSKITKLLKTATESPMEYDGGTESLMEYDGEKNMILEIQQYG